MSVGLLIEYSDGLTKSAWIPIATQAVFVSFWVPAAHLLGLEWLPLFETGIPVYKEDLPYVLDEMDLLRKWLASDPPSLTEGMAEFMAARLDRVITELEAVRHIPEAEIFIG